MDRANHITKLAFKKGFAQMHEGSNAAFPHGTKNIRNLQPGLYLYGKFGVRIEDSLVVTDNGCKILGGMPCLSMDDILSETL